MLPAVAAGHLQPVELAGHTPHDPGRWDSSQDSIRHMSQICASEAHGLRPDKLCAH